jgi:hypothetical protein
MSRPNCPSPKRVRLCLMDDSTQRRVAVLLRHVVGGGSDTEQQQSPSLPHADNAALLYRTPTSAMADSSSSVSPAGGPGRAAAVPAPDNATCAALTRLLDHDNHEMRDAMKAFMASDLYKPVRCRHCAVLRASTFLGCHTLTGLPPSCRTRPAPVRSATTCLSAWSASWRWSAWPTSATRSSSRCVVVVCGLHRILGPPTAAFWLRQHSRDTRLRPRTLCREKKKRTAPA